MKVRSAIKRICGFCQIIRRGKTLFVRCQKYGKHKQRQGFHTTDQNFVVGDNEFCECPEFTQLNIESIEHEQESCCDCKDSTQETKYDLFDKFENKLI